MKAEVEHVLVGWCGQEPILLNGSRVPDISVNSPGPNMFTLPNAVSNKYIRRDGYAFKCVRDCQGTQCVTENYVEFQTMVYPSNAISLYLKAENMSAQPLKNVLVTINSLSFSPDGEYPLVHNIDYPYQVNAGAATYTHGSTLANKGFSTTVNGVPMRVEQRPGYSSPQIVIGPFDLGPDVSADSMIEIPLQPPEVEFTRIPHSTDSLGGGTIGDVNPAGPCECSGVRIHGVPGAQGCEVTETTPSNYHCQLYYQASDAGGRICDQGCIPVKGCPPPWCFKDGQCSTGPMDQCPDIDGDGTGDKINCDENGCSKAVGNHLEFVMKEQSKPDEIDPRDLVSVMSTKVIDSLQRVLPSEVSDLFNGGVEKAYAIGCAQPCQNDPPPSIQGVGGIIPRDYNFICDPDDPEEASRCNGTDDQVIIPPDHPLFGTYRDVTGLGGCGYNASSNNTVLGPFEIVAEYGGQGDNRTSRSVLVASIPVGGRLIDDQARPYGWPMTGEITSDWGFTGKANAEGYYRGDPTVEYGEYRYCTNP